MLYSFRNRIFIFNIFFILVLFKNQFLLFEDFLYDFAERRWFTFFSLSKVPTIIYEK